MSSIATYPSHHFEILDKMTILDNDRDSVTALLVISRQSQISLIMLL